MKVTDAICRIGRISVILNILEVGNKNDIDESVIEDIANLLSEYKDELSNKIVK